MIDFFETKAFGAATVGALTTMISLYSGMNAWAAIGLGLLVASTFLLIFKKTALSRSPPDVTWARRVSPAALGNSWRWRPQRLLSHRWCRMAEKP
jgi:hypothetical protein